MNAGRRADAPTRRSGWRGRRVLITAGPTREPMDPVRFLTNSSSGTMGFALAREARARGARVVVISGPVTSEVSTAAVEVVPVVTAREMHREVLRRLQGADVVIAAAAVGDWRFERVSMGKIKKAGKALTLRLVPNPDIVADVARRLDRLSTDAKRSSGGRISRFTFRVSRESQALRRAGSGDGRKDFRRDGKVLVGFALETGRVVERARRKLRRKGLDLIVANGPDSIGPGRARVTIIDRLGGIRRYSDRSKSQAARTILRQVERFL